MATKRVVVKKQGIGEDLLHAKNVEIEKLREELKKFKRVAPELAKARVAELEKELAEAKIYFDNHVKFVKENYHHKHACENRYPANTTQLEAKLKAEQDSSDQLLKRIKRLQGALRHIFHVVTKANDPSFISYAQEFICDGTKPEKLPIPDSSDYTPEYWAKTYPLPKTPFPLSMKSDLNRINRGIIRFKRKGLYYQYEDTVRSLFKSVEAPFNTCTSEMWVGNQRTEYIHNMDSEHLKNTVRYLIETFGKDAADHVSFQGLMREMIHRGLLEFE